MFAVWGTLGHACTCGRLRESTCASVVTASHPSWVGVAHLGEHREAPGGSGGGGGAAPPRWSRCQRQAVCCAGALAALHKARLCGALRALPLPAPRALPLTRVTSPGLPRQAKWGQWLHLHLAGFKPPGSPHPRPHHATAPAPVSLCLLGTWAVNDGSWPDSSKLCSPGAFYAYPTCNQKHRSTQYYIRTPGHTQTSWDASAICPVELSRGGNRQA